MERRAKKIAIFGFLFVIILSLLLIKPIEDLDEIWNYNTARAIASGLIPYREVSMITTPFLPMINSLFLHGIFDQVITMRILAALLGAGICYLIYGIFRQIWNETNISLIATAGIGYLLHEFFCLDYNFANLFLALLLLLMTIKQNKKQQTIEQIARGKKRQMGIGILAGMCIGIKQTTGLTICLVTLLLPLLDMRKKEDIKEYGKILAYRIIGMAIPMVALLGYLIITQSLSDFISYCIQGISTFSNQIPYERLLENDKLEIQVLARLVPISWIIILIASIISRKNRQQRNNWISILGYGLAMLIVIYPISDEIHFLIGSTIFIVADIAILGSIGKIVLQKLMNKLPKLPIKRSYKIITLLIFLSLYGWIASKGANNLIAYNKQEKNETIAHYQEIEIKDYLKQRINEIDEYIIEKNKQGKTVYILDSEAAIYQIPLNHYHKNYDMFLKGNIGKEGEQGIIKQIQELQQDPNNVFLIRHPNWSQNWQTPMQVIKYVRDHLTKTGEISFYEEMKGN